MANDAEASPDICPPNGGTQGVARKITAVVNGVCTFSTEPVLLYDAERRSQLFSMAMAVQKDREEIDSLRAELEALPEQDPSFAPKAEKLDSLRLHLLQVLELRLALVDTELQWLSKAIGSETTERVKHELEFHAQARDAELRDHEQQLSHLRKWMARRELTGLHNEANAVERNLANVPVMSPRSATPVDPNAPVSKLSEEEVLRLLARRNELKAKIQILAAEITARAKFYSQVRRQPGESFFVPWNAFTYGKAPPFPKAGQHYECSTIGEGGCAPRRWRWRWLFWPKKIPRCLALIPLLRERPSGPRITADIVRW